MRQRISDHMSAMKPSAIREMLKLAAPDVISFTAGNPSADLFPAEELARITADVIMNMPARALQYSVTEGYAPLIEKVKAYLSSKYSIPTDGELIITSGAQQAIELTAKCLINPGDVVITENPSFIGALNAFRSYGARLVGAETDENGMVIEAVEEILKREKNVSFIYTIPTFQNPMGATMTMERRRRLLELAEKYDVIVLEDSPYFELCFSGKVTPPIKTMDTEGRILYAGTFSKTIAPGLRVGYALGPKWLISKMVVAKQVSDVHTNLPAMMAVDRILETYDLEGHIKQCRAAYKAKRDLMVAEMEKRFDPRVKFTRPEGGLFIWGELPEGCPSLGLCAIAQKHKVAVVPGMTFDPAESELNRGFRLNFSVPTEEQIVKGIRLMGESIDEYLAERV